MVSIRARRLGRANRTHPGASSSALGGFNPRPAVRPGESTIPVEPMPLCSCFNPRPAVRPGESGAAYPARGRRHVSIRARRLGRANPHRAPASAVRPAVSIRARRLGRANLCLDVAGLRFAVVSIRARRLGRANPMSTASTRASPRGFNPRPAVRPGESRVKTGNPASATVSIRARRLGRANPRYRRRPHAARRSFNPRPAVRPGESFTHRFECRYQIVSIRARRLGRANQAPCHALQRK